MRLRGRFALWFALAALVPIAAAALVTRAVVVRSYEDAYREDRAAVEALLRREVARAEAHVTGAVGSLASPDHPVIGGLLRELVKGAGTLDGEAQRRLREQGAPVMRGLSLDVLIVTDADDVVLAAPHHRAITGEVERGPAARAGQPAVFAWVELHDGAAPTTVLVATAAQRARDGAQAVAVLAGRRVEAELIAAVTRPGRVAAVVVRPTPAPAAPGVVRVPLLGEAGAPVALIEATVSDGGLAAVLRRVTLASAVLGGLALVLTTLLGVLVARRITRGLDCLAAGAEQAAGGNLAHRVPVVGRDEIGALATAFNDMMEELRGSKDRLVIAERIAAWQDVARRLAHEVKNPLTPIQMSMETLRKTHAARHPDFDEILVESTRTVLEEADRLRRIVTEFSEFARAPKPHLVPCDLGEIVAGALALYQGVAVERDLPAGLPEIVADRDQLVQVVLNLLENARDAIADGRGSKIAVRAAAGPAGDRVVLTITDDGPGVPAELKDRVFAPYFTTREGRGGTGLGLAIVHRIVADHGGRIAIADAPGGGAQVVIELPVEPGAPLRSSGRSGGMPAAR